MRGTTPLRYLLWGLLVVLAVACGGAAGDSDGVSVGEGSDSLFQNRLIANPGGNYSIDDFVSVGYKKSRQLTTESLPNVQDAWYGFFNQKDIELWLYPTHADAVEFGFPIAKSIVDDPGGVDPLNSIRGGTSVYGAHMVAGNVVMLCELEIGTCEALVAVVE